MVESRASVGASLPVQLKSSSNVRWELAHDSWRDWACLADEMLRCRRIPAGGTLLKQGPNRLIARVPRPAGGATGPESVVVKSFPMQHTRQILLGRYRRYGPAELEHLLRAREKGVPVPQVYGYAEKRLAGLMVTNTAVMMEDFSGAETLAGMLASQPTLKQEEAALAAAGSLLLRLHAAGCNHIDLNAGNIFLPAEGFPEGGVIDLMYACFHPAPSLNTLCFMAGYLANSMASHVPADRLDHWIAAVIAASEGATRQPYWLDVVSEFRRRRLSRHERLVLA